MHCSSVTIGLQFFYGYALCCYLSDHLDNQIIFIQTLLPTMLHLFLWVDVKIGGSMKHIVYILFIFHLLKVSNITPKQSLYSILFKSLVNFKWILNGSMVYTKLYRISDSVFFVMESRNSC